MTDASPPPVVPNHIEETIRTVARLLAEHRSAATPQQRMIDRMTDALGRPACLSVVGLLVSCWIGGNLLALALGRAPLDPPPFVWLSGAASLASLLMVIVVLGSQRHDDQLARRRELLTLELAMLNERKTAKVIELLEEGRRDNPLIRDRIDAQADDMAQPADPHSVLDAINESHDASSPQPDAGQ